MKSIKFIFGTLLLSAITLSCASQKNAFQKETVTIYGNCGMCESRIETAGTSKKTATVDWDQHTKLANISFDSTKTTLDEILKKIALAGHDSEEFLAPDKVYASLPGCCQYDRTSKPANTASIEELVDSTIVDENPIEVEIIEEAAIDYLAPVFNNYFALKDGLVQSNVSSTSAQATKLLASLNAVKMAELGQKEHAIWMKIKANLTEDAKTISTSLDIEKQRQAFIRLSEKMYELAKSAELEQPIYYEFCPMANEGKGATWLSKENVVKNPYYGSMMLSCGKVTETIK